ncbi:FtsB family cell division protein [Arabiibacter massiliensis]|uniref:FtsB family cell division protein n=1 Tax=Arabiibacter massiliensis TaxID=1870985 RepID=UPI001E36E955|nr:septum formation initiator family protein [Arabiibacter massiliensis]
MPASPTRSFRAESVPRAGSGRFIDVYDDVTAPPRGAHARASAQTAPRPARANAELPRAPEKTSRRDERKRSRSKAKAERKFERQFGSKDSAASDPAPEGGPRAAVYKGEMGSKHRHAARMQNEASGQPTRRTPLGFLASLKSSRAFIATMALAVCLVLSGSFLYPAAQQYYQALREHDRLAAEYAALSDRNDALQSDVNALQTDSGIEARAHEQLGWVKEGEQTANVRGLDLPEEAPTFRANITSDSIETPETWYSPFLDPLFGVE